MAFISTNSDAERNDLNSNQNERDYSGVPTAELARLYDQYIDVSDIEIFAARIGMDERDLKKIVQSQHYPFTGLRIADKILDGLDLNLSALVERGEIHVIPARDSMKAALRIVEDEIWATEEDPDFVRPSDEEIEARAKALLLARETYVVKTPEQEERLRRDSLRSQARVARNQGIAE